MLDNNLNSLTSDIYLKIISLTSDIYLKISQKLLCSVGSAVKVHKNRLLGSFTT